MKLKIAIILGMLVLSGCSEKFYQNTKHVECRGYINIQSIHKIEIVKLTKYDPNSGNFFSPGKPTIGMMGWYTTEPFSKIEYLNEAPRLNNK
ncbi:hypothetical protein [Xenorhabdus bovienii]|uniref:hypothetical protein n=1 Tax=Xenorhabdus bovienii TaxID=40576 RepID=UPI0023B2CD09|nr:hypothetical protein [Xenorhabdus bovienii]MDE9454575.1 hypothetical protein [Xenorhabdus bovienii]MDE9568817.1 hypothetical protein [Xenorhabdus bovienii]